jgi:hypothetical protein
VLFDGGTDYNSSTAASLKDTLAFPNAPVAAAPILAIQLNMMMEKADAGASGVKAVTRIGGTDYLGTESFPPVGYSDLRQIWDVKPSNSVAWSDTDFNAAEFGYIRST